MLRGRQLKAGSMRSYEISTTSVTCAWLQNGVTRSQDIHWIHCNRESAIKLICCRPQLMPRSWLVICGKPRLSVCQIYKRQWWWMQRGYTISAQGIGGSYTGWYNNIQPATTGWSSKANDGWSNKKTKVDMASDIQAALSQMEEKLCISSGQFHILYEPTKAHPTRNGAGPLEPKFFTPKISSALFDLQPTYNGCYRRVRIVVFVVWCQFVARSDHRMLIF